MSQDFRLVSGQVKAERTTPTFARNRGSNDAARLGLAYERRVVKELQHHVDIGNLVRVEHNPWFAFEDEFGAGTCSPDIIVYGPQFVQIVEVKLRWVPVAQKKLEDLYRPVVCAAYGILPSLLVLCRYVTPETPKPVFTLRDAVKTTGAVLNWPANGRIPW
jgi:hypothetical protein